MEEVQLYYLRSYHLSESHKMAISMGMKRMYAKKGGKRTLEEKQHISEGMKKCWTEWKNYWREQGLI